MTDKPTPWFRYANEPDALAAITFLNAEEVRRRPSLMDWASIENAEIDAWLRRLARPAA